MPGAAAEAPVAPPDGPTQGPQLGYRAFIRHAPDGISVHDLDGHLLEVNEAFAISLGYPLDAVASLRPVDVEAPEGGWFGDRLARLVDGDQVRFETDHRRVDGSRFPVEVTARLVADDGTPVIVAFHHDVSEARRAAVALQESEYFFRESQAAAFIGSYKMDVRSGRWASSRVLDDIFGLGPEFERSVDGWLSIVHPDDREEMGRYLAEEVFAKQQPFDMEYRIVRPSDGQLRWVAGRGQVVVDEAGAVVAMTGTIQDITDRREAAATQSRLEAMLVASQKLEAIGRLAGGVAHDFNNMLTVILGNVDAALEDVEPGSGPDVALGEIRAAAMRSAALTRQLLTFARKQVIAPRAQDLNSLVDGMLTMLRRLIGEDIQLRWRPGAELWPVLIDAVQVDQILANLCVNARDALAGGGVVEIGTANRVLDAAFAEAHPDTTPGEYVLLTFSDNGCGMDDETLTRLFEPFFTTKDDGLGTGLGLATVYGIVKQNHGFIEVESAVGCGARFSIHLPRHHGTLHPAADGAAPVLPAQRHGTILVVEDEPAILRAIAARLRSRGYTVLTADSPAVALQAARASQEPLDLLLTDVILPGVNGRELAAAIRRLHPTANVLFMSGYSADIISAHGSLDEGVDFIQKPMRFDDLELRIGAALASRDPR